MQPFKAKLNRRRPIKPEGRGLGSILEPLMDVTIIGFEAIPITNTDIGAGMFEGWIEAIYIGVDGSIGSAALDMLTTEHDPAGVLNYIGAGMFSEKGK